MLTEVDAVSGVTLLLMLMPIILAAGWFHRQRDKRRRQRPVMSTQTPSIIPQTTTQAAQLAADITLSPIPFCYAVGLKFRLVYGLIDANNLFSK